MWRDLLHIKLPINAYCLWGVEVTYVEEYVVVSIFGFGG